MARLRKSVTGCRTQVNQSLSEGCRPGRKVPKKEEFHQWLHLPLLKTAFPLSCLLFLFSLSLCPLSHYPPFLLSFFSFVFMSLLEEINFIFSFHWTKGLGDGGHISSCCRFSYSLAKIDISLWKPKGGAVVKGDSRAASRPGGATSTHKANTYMLALHWDADPGGFASKT